MAKADKEPLDLQQWRLILWGLGLTGLVLLAIVKSTPVRKAILESSLRHHPGDVRKATELARLHLLEYQAGGTRGDSDRTDDPVLAHVESVLSRVPENVRNDTFAYWWADVKTLQSWGHPGDDRLRHDALNAVEHALSLRSPQYRTEVTAWLHFARGLLGFQERDYSAACRHAQQVVKLEQSQSACHQLLFESRVEFQLARDRPDRHELDLAIADFTPWLGKLEEDDRREAEAYIKKAKAAMKDG